MGAVCACSEEKRIETNSLLYYPLEFFDENETIFGVQGYKELEETECADLYKNVHERQSGVRLTVSGLTTMFKTQVKAFSKFMPRVSNKLITVESVQNA